MMHGGGMQPYQYCHPPPMRMMPQYPESAVMSQYPLLDNAQRPGDAPAGWVPHGVPPADAALGTTLLRAMRLMRGTRLLWVTSTILCPL